MATLHRVWWHHCGRKIQHPDEGAARQAIAEIEANGRVRPDERLEAYPCNFEPVSGGHWHVGHAADSGPSRDESVASRVTQRIHDRLRCLATFDDKRKNQWSNAYEQDVRWLLGNYDVAYESGPAFWLPKAGGEECSEPGCTRPSIVWTKRRSFCVVCVPPSALLKAYEQVRVIALAAEQDRLTGEPVP